jgi:hypothetical protein
MGGPVFSGDPGIREVGNGRIRNSDFRVPPTRLHHRGTEGTEPHSGCSDPSQDHPEVAFVRGLDLSPWILWVLCASVVQWIPRIDPCARLGGGDATVAPPPRCCLTLQLPLPSAAVTAPETGHGDRRGSYPISPGRSIADEHNVRTFNVQTFERRQKSRPGGRLWFWTRPLIRSARGARRRRSAGRS